MKSRVTPFKRWEVEDDYDVIVVGSGMGGLATASLLSRLAGMKVLVLEQHYEPGGFTHTFKRPGFEWDVGVHYIGGVHPKTMLGKLFDLITDGTLSWEDMGEVYDRAFIGDFSFDFRKGRKNLVADLKAVFPDEHDAIDNYFSRVKEATQASGMFFLEKLLPPAISALVGGQVTANFDKIASKTTEEVLDELTDNALLRAVLTTQWGDYGLPPSRSSFAMHAMVAAHYFYGAYYPVGGSSRIAESIIPVIEETGGKVLVRATVSSVLVENNTAVGVKMEDGREIRAPFIVSDAGASNTFEQLVPPAVRQKFGLTDVFRRVRPSAAHLCLYLGFDETADALGLERANLWITPDEELDHNIARSARDSSAPLPVVYVSFPAAKDPDFARKFPGKATVEAITIAPYEWVAKWEGTPWKQRGNDYEAFKAEMTQRLLDVVFEHVPQLRDKVTHCELSTPLSTSHFAAYTRGEIYGLENTPARFAQRMLRPQTPLKGLYLTGQDVATCGVAGALFGGVLSTVSVMQSRPSTFGRALAYFMSR